MEDSFDQKLRNTSTRALMKRMLTTLTPKDTPGPLRAPPRSSQRKRQLSEKEGEGDVSLALQSSAHAAVTPLRPTDQTYGFLSASLNSGESSLNESIDLQAASRFQAKKRRLKIPDQAESFKLPRGRKKGRKSSSVKNSDMKSSALSSDKTYAGVSAMDSSDSSLNESINVSSTAARFKKKIKQPGEFRVQDRAQSSSLVLPKNTSQSQETEEAATGDKTYANLSLESSTDSIDLGMARRLRYPRQMMTVFPEMPRDIIAHLKASKDKAETSKLSLQSSETPEKENANKSVVDTATKNQGDSYSLLEHLTEDEKSVEEVEHIKDRFSHKGRTLNLNLTRVMKGIKQKPIPDTFADTTETAKEVAGGSPSKEQVVTVVEVHNPPSFVLPVNDPQPAGDVDQMEEAQVDETILPPPSFRDSQQDTEEAVQSQGLSTSFSSESSDENEMLKNHISQALTDLEDDSMSDNEEVQAKADMARSPSKSESPHLRRSPRKSVVREEIVLPAPSPQKKKMSTPSKASPRRSLMREEKATPSKASPRKSLMREEKATPSKASPRKSLMREAKATPSKASPRRSLMREEKATPSKASPRRSLMREEKATPSKANADRNVSENFISPLEKSPRKSITREESGAHYIPDMSVRRENILSHPEVEPVTEGKDGSHTETAICTDVQEENIAQPGEFAEEDHLIQGISEVEGTEEVNVEDDDKAEEEDTEEGEEVEGKDIVSSVFLETEDDLPQKALLVNTGVEVAPVADDRDKRPLVQETSAYGEITKATDQSSPEKLEKSQKLPNPNQEVQRGHTIDKEQGEEDRQFSSEENTRYSLPADIGTVSRSLENLMDNEEAVTKESTEYATIVEEADFEMEELPDRESYQSEGAMQQQPDRPASPSTSQDIQKPSSETEKMRQMTMKEYLQKLAVKPMAPPVSTKPKVYLPGLIKTGKTVAQKPGIAAPSTKNKTASKKKASLPTTLPHSMNKEVFSHFAKCRVGSDALKAATEVSSKYWQNVSADLVSLATARKGPEEITAKDVVKLFFRQGLVNSRDELYSLVEEYLPHEDWNILLSTTYPKNVVHPKNSDPLSLKNLK